MILKLNKNSLFHLKAWAFVTACCLQLTALSQDVNPLLKKVKAKLDKVNDYIAEGRMKTDVAFIKAPAGKVKVLYKRPNKFKLKRGDGISLLPKGGVSVNMSNLLENGDYVALAAGDITIGATKVKAIKLLPTNENSDVVLTTLYIDEANLLILKASTTTKENGTFETEMTYDKFAQFGLPDKVTFAFNTKDFKLPKGLTMEFDTGEKKPDADKMKNKKGKIEITYFSYIINKGVSDAEFRSLK